MGNAVHGPAVETLETCGAENVGDPASTRKLQVDDQTGKPTVCTRHQYVVPLVRVFVDM